jgi:hypothetical protein
MNTGKWLIGLLLATALLALSAGSAAAAVPIESFVTSSTDTQAGGHPDLSTSFVLDNSDESDAARNVTFDAPQGLFGNPNAITRCTASDFALDECPAASQAGIITVRGAYKGDPNFLFGTAPLYDMVPQAIETARFDFVVPVLGLPIAIPVEVRTGGDYGLRFRVSEITQSIPLKSADLTFWGMPALSAHDAQRFPKGSPGTAPGCPEAADTSCIEAPVAASLAPKPLIDNPTLCTGGNLVTTLTVQSYAEPDHPSQAIGEYPKTDGCEHLTFKPVLSANLTTHAADSPSGLDLGFRVPQTLGSTPTPSSLRQAVVTLPAGLSVNPDAADGQTSCSDAAAKFGSEAPSECPDEAKIGTVEIGTPALDGPLKGAMYIGEPKPGDQYRLFLILTGFGLNAKLVGSVRPDPETGQLTVYFNELPQVPFETIDIHLFASNRGLMATPSACTIYKVQALFEPWNAVLAAQTSEQFIGISTGPNGAQCPGPVRPFHPRLVAGTTSPLAGGFSDFSLKLDRDDGDQFLGDLTFRMPPGFTGDLRGIPYCSDASIAAAAQKLGRAEQAAASCPAASQIGTSNVAAGPGLNPFHAVGKMYLAGPLKGAPLSLVAITPALAGPYDYGVVVVRVALHVDPLTAQVFAASDTVPSIIGGIPIRMRSIQVHIDRPNFTINPTNCSPFTVDSQGIGDQGTVTNFSSYFHVVNCAALPFKPSMTVRQVGKKSTGRSANPELRFDLRTRPGDANIKSLSVTLPSALAIDQRHLGNICSEKELTEKRCAGRTPIGEATTTTPLLDQPLSGPVYAVSGSGGLPRLAFILDGQVNLLPRAETDTIAKNGAGKLRTTVPVVPDAPIGHFALTVFGGKSGYLVNTRSLCGKAPVAKMAYDSQSGKSYAQSVKIKAACPKKSKKARSKRHAR